MSVAAAFVLPQPGGPADWQAATLLLGCAMLAARGAADAREGRAARPVAVVRRAAGAGAALVSSIALARVMHNGPMSNEQRGVAVNLLMRRSGVTFFTRRVLQRWLRGEISTDTAIELIESDDAVRIVAAWRPGSD